VQIDRRFVSLASPTAGREEVADRLLAWLRERGA